MSSRPPPPPPVYPREPPPPPSLQPPSSSAASTPPTTMTALQTAAVPVQLPGPGPGPGPGLGPWQGLVPGPPPIHAPAHHHRYHGYHHHHHHRQSQHRRASRPPPLPRLGPLAVAPVGPAPPYHSPTVQVQPGHERGYSAPQTRLGYGQLYTPPWSDPSYSPQYVQPLHPQAEVAARPLLPPFEQQQQQQRAWPGEGRRDVPAYPSPAYAEYRASEEEPSPATPPASRGGAASLQVEPTFPAPGPPPQTTQQHPFVVEVRQQPLAARACGFGERDRRVIDPPPIVQLVPRDATPGAVDLSELRYPFNVVHCTLWNEDGSADETAIPSQDRGVTRRLMGTLVASPFVGKDENDREGCFFCFPDLSCRTHGRYRLRFVLMRMDMTNLRPGGFMPVLATAMTDVFTVYTAKEFPGMRASTSLTRALKRQGCAISVKKGNERAPGSGRGQSTAEEGSPA